ncbi:MAG: hypothetical protein H6703_16115 [Myxococcales bacterium]|nr:hypothetical protein [Myxococcales bacterium]
MAGVGGRGGRGGAGAGGDAARAAAARAALGEALAVVGAAPDRAAVARAEAAMAALRGLVDTAFHAPNLRDEAARPHALALRGEVARLLAGEAAVMVLRDDVLHFRPAVHRALAGAARALGDAAGEVAHRRAVVAAAPEGAADWVALRDAWLAAGDRRSAAAVDVERLQAAPGGPVIGAPDGR